MYNVIRNHFVVILLLLFFITMSVFSSLHESLTFDEYVYLQGGRDALLTHTFTVDPYNPPLSMELTALPYVFLSSFHANDEIARHYPFAGRMVVILLSCTLLVSVYLFTWKVVGKNQALLAAFLFALDPAILANNHYVTIDMLVTLLFFITVALCISLINRFSFQKFFICAFFIGLGCATKITFIPYVAVSFVLLLFLTKKISSQEVWKKCRGVFLSCIIIVLTVWTCYFFTWNVVIKDRADSTRVSARIVDFASSYHIQYIAKIVFFLEHQPIPLGDYVAILKNNILRSGESSTCFFMGNFSSCTWYFMPTNFFLKTPLPLWILFFVSIIQFVVKQRKIKRDWMILVPIIGVLSVSMVFRMAPWVRYVMPAVPWFVIFASLSIPFWLSTRTRKIFLMLLLSLYALGTILSMPHVISYANELTLGQKHFLFIDSNMDWGQALPDVRDFILHKKLKGLQFSYFGRDNGDWYGLHSSLPYGSYKNNEICAFHTIGQNGIANSVQIISISNWYYCGYNKIPKFSKGKIRAVVADSFFVF